MTTVRQAAVITVPEKPLKIGKTWNASQAFLY